MFTTIKLYLNWKFAVVKDIFYLALTIHFPTKQRKLKSAKLFEKSCVMKNEYKKIVENWHKHQLTYTEKLNGKIIERLNNPAW